MAKVTPFLMFNDQLEAAVEFYTATFPDSEIRNVARTGKGGPIASAEFVVGGQLFMGYNGGPHFTFSEGFPLYLDCVDQREVDEYWDKLVRAGAKPTQCGWIKDPLYWSMGDPMPRHLPWMIAANAVLLPSAFIYADVRKRRRAPGEIALAIDPAACNSAK